MHAQGMGAMPHMMPPHQLVHHGQLDPRLHHMQHPGLLPGPQHLQDGHPAVPIHEPYHYPGHQGMVHPGPDQVQFPFLPLPPHVQHGRLL